MQEIGSSGSVEGLSAIGISTPTLYLRRSQHEPRCAKLEYSRELLKPAQGQKKKVYTGHAKRGAAPNASGGFPSEGACQFPLTFTGDRKGGAGATFVDGDRRLIIE